MKLPSYLVVLLLLFFIACNNSSNNNDIMKLLKYWDKREIIFPDSSSFSKYGTGESTSLDSLLNSTYKILVYTDSMGCMSCKLNFQGWKHFINHVDSISNHSVSFLFYFHSNDYEEMNYILRRDRFTYPVCFDKNDELNQLNKLPQEFAFQTFLLDKDNRVIALGNPMSAPKVKDLYLKIITGEMPVEVPVTKINVKKSEINVGNFSRQNRKIALFTLENTGDNPLTIRDIVTSCGCTSVNYAKEPTEPGDKIEIFVELKPETTGNFEETIAVYCNVAESPVALKILGIAE